MDFVSELNGRLLFAIPKKGRLYERCLKLLTHVDVQHVRKNRLDIALATNMEIALLFLPAADIARYVGEGRVDLGITGKDVVAESQVEVEVELPLGFGKCQLCVQTPKEHKITDPKTLVGKRIVTSFPHLAQQYFNALDPSKETHVTHVSGSVEVACALGLADAVVDLVESGDTMRAAGLEVADVIMDTEAVLISNPKTIYPELIHKLKKRIQGVMMAEKYVIIEFNCPREKLLKVKEIVPGQKAPTMSTLEDPEWVAVKSMIKASETYDKIEQLELLGARDIFTTKIEKCSV